MYWSVAVPVASFPLETPTVQTPASCTHEEFALHDVLLQHPVGLLPLATARLLRLGLLCLLLKAAQTVPL